MPDSERASGRRIAATIALAIGSIVLLMAAGGPVLGWFLGTPPAPEASAAGESNEPPPASSPTTTIPTASPREASETAPASTPPAEHLGVVAIDAGHQARQDTSDEPIGPGATEMKNKVESGAVGSAPPHTPESKVNLAVALKLQQALEARGVKVVMIRTSEDVNISNSERAGIANKAEADLFVRLHCDGSDDESLHGISTLVPGPNEWTKPIIEPSMQAGKIVHRRLLEATGATDRGVVQRSDLRGFNWSQVPSVLVEMGFMSNQAEDRKLDSTSYQQVLADGIADGIVEYLQIANQ